jgi:hypothetical protein
LPVGRTKKGEKGGEKWEKVRKNGGEKNIPTKYTYMKI